MCREAAVQAADGYRHNRAEQHNFIFFIRSRVNISRVNITLWHLKTIAFQATSVMLRSDRVRRTALAEEFEAHQAGLDVGATAPPQPKAIESWPLIEATGFLPVVVQLGHRSSAN